MTYKIDGDSDGVFVKAATNILRPLDSTNFVVGDSVDIEFVEQDEFGIITDLGINTPNPYTEIWEVIKITIPTRRPVETSVDTNTTYYHPLDIILYATVVLVTVWMLVVDIKILLENLVS